MLGVANSVSDYCSYIFTRYTQGFDHAPSFAKLAPSNKKHNQATCVILSSFAVILKK
jgi:hypothetical protein